MKKEDLKSLEATLWHSADTLRANSDLKSTEYSTPVLGLIFLKFADNKYALTKERSSRNMKASKRPAGQNLSVKSPWKDADSTCLIMRVTTIF
jgi:type I restriction-modification system DNA methylase subunit